MPRRKRAALYYRISRDRTGSMAGVDRQRHECQALAAERDLDVVGEFTDNDLSAYSGKPRPAYAAMLAEVTAGRVDVVVAWHPDRLVRHPRELEDLIDALEAARCPVETVRAGAVDLTTRSGRTTARLVGAVARDESEAKAERLQAMHAAKARAGEWSGGTRPYGYRSEGGTLVAIPDEAEVVREAARRVLAGESVHGVCADLNARGIPTARGALWRAQTLRRILTSPTHAGRREHKGEDVGPATWPAIIDARDHRRLVAAIVGRGPTRGTVARVSLLAGLLRCSICDASLITQRRTTGARVYVCPARSIGGCGGLSIVADPVDELVAAAVVARVDGPALADLLAADPDDTDPATEVAEVEHALVELAADLGAGRLSRAEWLAAREGYDSRLTELRGAVGATTDTAVLRTFAGTPGALLAAWPALTLDQRRAIVAAVVQSVPIHPATRRGPGFDPDRVDVIWKA